MLHATLTWALAAAFAGAGLVNATGLAGTRDNFARWNYPWWSSHGTGVLEIAIAVAIAVPASRGAGLLLGALVIVAAVLTVLRFRERSHLAPLALFAALLALVGFMP